MKKKKKKITKTKKKFFIILTCYIAVFLITSITTAATLAWFNSSTWSRDTLYMGGPVYIYFANSANERTSGENALTLKTPSDWDLYPGMNINLQARAVVQGAQFDHTEETGEETIVYATGAILRARISLRIYDKDGNINTLLTQPIYNNLWAQIKIKAGVIGSGGNEGVWILDKDFNYVDYGNALDSSLDEEHFFYYVVKNQSFSNSGKYKLLDINPGGEDELVSVGFLDDAVVTLSPQFVNDHAECRVGFTIVFQAFQAFLPYLKTEVGQPYTGSEAGHGSHITWNDVGRPKDLTIENCRDYFHEAFAEIYGDIPEAIY